MLPMQASLLPPGDIAGDSVPADDTRSSTGVEALPPQPPGAEGDAQSMLRGLLAQIDCVNQVISRGSKDLEKLNLRQTRLRRLRSELKKRRDHWRRQHADDMSALGHEREQLDSLLKQHDERRRQLDQHAAALDSGWQRLEQMTRQSAVDRERFTANEVAQRDAQTSLEMSRCEFKLEQKRLREQQEQLARRQAELAASRERLEHDTRALEEARGTLAAERESAHEQHRIVAEQAALREVQLAQRRREIDAAQAVLSEREQALRQKEADLCAQQDRFTAEQSAHGQRRQALDRDAADLEQRKVQFAGEQLAFQELRQRLDAQADLLASEQSRFEEMNRQQAAERARLAEEQAGLHDAQRMLGKELARLAAIRTQLAARQDQLQKLRVEVDRQSTEPHRSQERAGRAGPRVEENLRGAPRKHMGAGESARAGSPDGKPVATPLPIHVAAQKKTVTRSVKPVPAPPSIIVARARENDRHRKQLESSSPPGREAPAQQPGESDPVAGVAPVSLQELRRERTVVAIQELWAAIPSVRTMANRVVRPALAISYRKRLVRFVPWLLRGIGAVVIVAQFYSVHDGWSLTQAVLVSSMIVVGFVLTHRLAAKVPLEWRMRLGRTLRRLVRSAHRKLRGSSSSIGVVSEDQPLPGSVPPLQTLPDRVGTGPGRTPH